MLEPQEVLLQPGHLGPHDCRKIFLKKEQLMKYFDGRAKISLQSLLVALLWKWPVFVENEDLWRVNIFWNAIVILNWKQQHRFLFQVRMWKCAAAIWPVQQRRPRTFNKRLVHWHIIEKSREEKIKVSPQIGETFDESRKTEKGRVQTVTAGFISFQHVCLNQATCHFGFLCNLPDKVSHLDNRAMKKSWWLDRKSKRIASTWTQHYVIPCLL